MENFIFCPSKANTEKLKNISCNRNEPKKCISTWQTAEVSNAVKCHADNNGLVLSKQRLTASLWKWCVEQMFVG